MPRAISIFWGIPWGSGELAGIADIAATTPLLGYYGMPSLSVLGNIPHMEEKGGGIELYKITVQRLRNQWNHFCTLHYH
jgi:hypothetical protein